MGKRAGWAFEPRTPGVPLLLHRARPSRLDGPYICGGTPAGAILKHKKNRSRKTAAAVDDSWFRQAIRRGHETRHCGAVLTHKKIVCACALKSHIRISFKNTSASVCGRAKMQQYVWPCSCATAVRPVAAATLTHGQSDTNTAGCCLWWCTLRQHLR